VGLARGSQSEQALVEACAEWAANERRLDELKNTMGCVNAASDKNLRARVRRIAGRVKQEPLLLVNQMGHIERGHPWSRALANVMIEMEEQLD